jgi:hypothetical protein
LNYKWRRVEIYVIAFVSIQFRARSRWSQKGDIGGGSPICISNELNQMQMRELLHENRNGKLDNPKTTIKLSKVRAQSYRSVKFTSYLLLFQKPINNIPQMSHFSLHCCSARKLNELNENSLEAGEGEFNFKSQELLYLHVVHYYLSLVSILILSFYRFLHFFFYNLYS